MTQYLRKFKTHIIFILIVIGSIYLMTKQWGISYDPAFVGGICLGLIWLANNRLSKIETNIKYFVENTHRYLLDPRELMQYQIKSYVEEAAIYAINNKKISIGMTADQVGSALRELIISRIKTEIRDQENDVKDAINFASGWELMNIWCHNEQQLPEEAFKDNPIYVSSDKEEHVLLVNKLRFPVQYVSVYFKNKKLTGWKIYDEP